MPLLTNVYVGKGAQSSPVQHERKFDDEQYLRHQVMPICQSILLNLCVAQERPMYVQVSYNQSIVSYLDKYMNIMNNVFVFIGHEN